MFVFKQKTAYEMRISDWSSDVCSSDLATGPGVVGDLVVIDGGDERVALVQGAQVGVGLVEGVAPSVVLEGHDLVARVVASTDVAPGAEAALVEVVAEDRKSDVSGKACERKCRSRWCAYQ